MLSLAKQEKMWASGRKNYRLKEGFQKLADWFATELGDRVKRNRELTSVNYGGAGVELVFRETDTGKLQQVQAEKAVLSLPLGILKKEGIHFIPELPPAKRQAIQAIGTDAGVKVFVRFEKRCWPQEMTDLWGGEWCAAYTANPRAEVPVICAYLMGRHARSYLAMPPAKRKEKLLAELKVMLGEIPAVTGWQEEDWQGNRLFGGAYSYASRHAQEHRETLFEPIENKVFFAGEACHFEGHPATVHGAMETAEWVAEDILGQVP